MTKWIEIASFQPIDRDHSEKGTGDKEPWVGGPAQEAIRRHFIETRYELMPYLYTLAEEASRTGLPLERPLFLEFPDATPDRHPIDLDVAASGEFLLGPDLLIAPPPFPDEMDEYQAELPGSGWYDFWTGKRVHATALPPPITASVDPASEKEAEQPLAVRVTPRLDELPVFVRAGAILPMAPLVQSTDETPQGPLTLRIYAGDPCTGSLYLDDGKSYAFQQGAYLRMNFGCRITAQGMDIEIGAHQGSFRAWWKEIRIEIYGWTPSKGEVLVNGQKVAASKSQSKKEVAFQIADDGKGANVEFR